MKISLSSVIRTLTILNLFLPVCTAVCYCFGYKFALFNYAVCSVIFATISVSGVIFSFISKEKISKKSDMAMLAFLPVLSLVNSGLYLYGSEMKSSAAKVSISLCFICSVIIVIKYVRPIILKILSIASASLAILPIMLFVGLLLEPFSKITVIESLPSPEGTYYAEVTDVDTGALGGETCVHIYKTNKLDFLVFSITEKPDLIFIGEWKEYETMQIEWISEQHLLIDEILHEIKEKTPDA